MAETKNITNRQLLAFFESKLKSHSPESAQKYKQTIRALDLFTATHALALADIDDSFVCDWAVSLLRQGLAVSTVIRHLNILSSLLKSASKKGLIQLCDSPRRIATILGNSADPVPPLLTDAALTRSLAIVASSDHGLPSGLLRFALINGAMPVDEIASLRREDIDRFSGDSRLILDSFVSSGRSYIFPLDQSRHTKRQLSARIAALLAPIFARMNIPAGADPDEAIRSLWVAIAMSRGATASSALSAVGQAAPYTIPRCLADKICLRTEGIADSSELTAEVANALTSERPEWFAMHLRRGVDFNSLSKDIHSGFRPVPELFFPCEIISRIRRNKKELIEKPFISRTAFFRMPPGAVTRLFALIGDRAWCYRVNNSPTSQYARIPDAEMRRFRNAVGILTPDTDLHPLGEITPVPGETVIVITPGYDRREATVEDVINPGSHTAIIRVRLSTDLGYEWRADLSSHQIERILQAKS